MDKLILEIELVRLTAKGRDALRALLSELSRPAAMAASASKYVPSSEKLSGVTFKTPMRSVRFPRTREPERRRSRNDFR